MAKVAVTTPVAAGTQHAWETASDLSRFGDWLDLLEGWRGEVPSVIDVGTTLTCVLKVKGMRNRVEWTVTGYTPPQLITLDGRGKGGSKVRLVIGITPAGEGSTLRLEADFSAPGLIGPVGSALARSLNGGVQESLTKLARLIEAR